MHPIDDADYGLLAPVWAGTAVVGVTSDRSVLAAMIEVEVALAHVQAPVEIAERIETALRDSQIDVAELAVAARGGGNPVIPLLKLLRPLLDDDAARWLHRGATSQDVLDTALMLIAGGALRIVLQETDAAIAALARLVDQHRRTVMAARTLTQHATPTTFGLKAAIWLEGLVISRDRLREVAAALPAQLGGASGTLASFTELAQQTQGAPEPVDVVTAFAERLELAAPRLPWHVMRHPVTSLGDALVSLCDAFGTIATNVATLGRTEIGELAEGSGGGSSAMPHKRNPVLSTLIRSAALRAPGLAAELHRAAVTVDERPDGAWHSEWQALRELLRLAGGTAESGRALLEHLQVHPERMRANLDATAGLIVSERVMLRLAPRIGAKRVQHLIDEAATTGTPLREALTAALPDLDASELEELTDAARYTGAADDLIERSLTRALKGAE
ncbi:lyase family protein [Ruicaihuangia caeni]|uniref:Lyase family protein n=1 Tax=Ruicaihuangia caeni TaxID=3042517 RepID=A0AAW6TA70_9MICO|nr:lyase family protein [Klugiella sp. YN-L-19]MDI2099304.1 lyase family protein [Klugiella sp. YN-L-19]